MAWPIPLVQHGAISVLPTVLVALVLIMVVAHLFGHLADRCGQPRVLGEILGGIVLGPSCLGRLAPVLHGHLFGAAVIPELELLAQLGLILFMFLVGLEMSPTHIQGRVPLAMRLSAGATLVPLASGLVLAHVLEQIRPELLPGDELWSGALFVGTALASTAFPVLARILKERGILATNLGQLAITTAAATDVIGWALLAAVVAFSRSGSAFTALTALTLAGLWAAVLLLGMQPLMARLGRNYQRSRQLGRVLMSLIFAGAILSAVVTQAIGIHYIFGAFLFGLALPRYVPLLRRLQQRTEDVVLTLLLPVFFMISGLHTELGSLNTRELWCIAGLLLVTAVGSKLLGTWGVARLGGLPQREALALAWLMNTRGLTELVILNVGLSLGVISTELFTMMVVMALATSAMTTPLVRRLGYGGERPLSCPLPQLS